MDKKIFENFWRKLMMKDISKKYRYLTVGNKIQEKDEIYYHSEWIPITKDFGATLTYSDVAFYSFRRPIKVKVKRREG